jgi:protein-S-isoprenylcysteine O-methyltransferase Ste14
MSLDLRACGPALAARNGSDFCVNTAALWARAIIYFLLFGGGWLVALPAGILSLENRAIWPIVRNVLCGFLGGLLFAIGFVLACRAGACPIHLGRGTPLPLDPPRRLVTRGPYRWVRNPQRIAMLLMVIGEVVAIDFNWLWVMVPSTILDLEGIEGRWEEKQLLRNFGDEYVAYTKRTRKRMPRFSGGEAERTANSS